MNILLTRPLNQVEPLAVLVRNQGLQGLLFPTLQVDALMPKLLKKKYDVCIFISVNAVDYGLSTLNTLYDSSVQIFAVGSATAKRLNKHGFKVDAFPNEKASSESLLAMPQVAALSAKNILIFRGKGGRERLKQGLGKSNQVSYLEVYQRTQVPINTTHRQSLTQFLANTQGVITMTSIESLLAMMSMIEQIGVDAMPSIKRYPLAVLSERVATYAKSIGFGQIAVAPKTNDLGLMQAVDCFIKR